MKLQGEILKKKKTETFGFKPVLKHFGTHLVMLECGWIEATSSCEKQLYVSNEVLFVG